jgi:hypothetical protein
VNKTKLVLETGRGTDRLSVRVIDEESRTMIVQFDLEPGNMWAFLGGAYVEIDGQVTENFDRVGKVMKTDSVVYSAKDLSASTYDQQLADAEAMARADRPGWDVYSAHRQGGGYGRVQVTLRRWE